MRNMIMNGFRRTMVSAMAVAIASAGSFTAFASTDMMDDFNSEETTYNNGYPVFVYGREVTELDETEGVYFDMQKDVLVFDGFEGSLPDGSEAHLDTIDEDTDANGIDGDISDNESEKEIDMPVDGERSSSPLVQCDGDLTIEFVGDNSCFVHKDEEDSEIEDKDVFDIGGETEYVGDGCLRVTSTQGDVHTIGLNDTEDNGNGDGNEDKTPGNSGDKEGSIKRTEVPDNGAGNSVNVVNRGSANYTGNRGGGTGNGSTSSRPSGSAAGISQTAVTPTTYTVSDNTALSQAQAARKAAANRTTAPKVRSEIKGKKSLTTDADKEEEGSKIPFTGFLPFAGIALIAAAFVINRRIRFDETLLDE